MSRLAIQRFKIENFRRFRAPLELRMASPRGTPCKTITLAGPNGCGKTTVLEAVLLGLGKESLIVRDIEKSQREQHWRVAVPDGARVELDVLIGDGRSVSLLRTSSKHVMLTAEGERPIPDEIRDARVELFSSWRAPELVGPVRPLAGGKRPSDNENNRLWRLKQKVCDELARLGFPPADSDQKQKSRASDWLSRINQARSKFHGNDGTTIAARLVEPQAEEEPLRADLFVMREETVVCPIDQVSSGEIELLSFAGWLILGEFRDGLLLIDEPELHLHPQWQARLLPALRALSPTTQIMLASHADVFWDQAAPFERFLLVEDSDPRSSAWRHANQTGAAEEET